MNNKLYVCREVLNPNDLIEWAKEQGFKQCLHASEYHVTIAYSKTPVDWDNWSPLENKFKYKKKEREIKKFGDCIVLAINSDYLTTRWQEFIDGGCSWDYDDYSPHITITYDGADIDPSDIKPFTGEILFGREIFKPLMQSGADIKSNIQHISLDESVFRLTDTNQDNLYTKFKDTYEKSTGASWTRDKFLSRARHWEFYGSEDGFVSLRPQRSGFYKLVGMAGSPQGILAGMGELQASHQPVWGAVSETLSRVAKRKGMIVPHTVPGGVMVLRAIMKSIPASVFGGADIEISKNGSVQMEYDDVGKAEKYFVCNKEYLMKLSKMPEFIEKISVVPGAKMFFKLFGIDLTNT